MTRHEETTRRQYVVIGYPQITQQAQACIDLIREQHDDHAELLRSHITFVFPWAALSPSDFIGHLRDAVSCGPEIRFCLRKAIVYTHRLSTDNFAFLVPDEGTCPMKAGRPWTCCTSACI